MFYLIMNAFQIYMANGIVIGSGSGTQKPALLIFKPNPSVKKAKKN